ncbi:MAG: hypothetical protein H7Y13_11285 [Sphingobacteriaceae bacterium]|nr:hypothetical protein [Sphingobacteriaceae bacterium]
MKRLFFLILISCLLACSKNDSAPTTSGSTAGSGGSLARFALSSDHLYTVSPSHLTAYNVATAENPVEQKEINLGFGVETIFPYKNNLFIGTETGMKIMDITNPHTPVFLSSYEHIRSCDPVVANDEYAFVTLRSGTTCRQGINALNIIDIKNLSTPKLVQTYTLNKPYGLAIDGTNLFVCDGGIRHYDATDAKNLSLKSTTPIEATDVIANNGVLMVIGKDGIYQYDYSGGSLVFLSKIATSEK